MNRLWERQVRNTTSRTHYRGIPIPAYVREAYYQPVTGGFFLGQVWSLAVDNALLRVQKDLVDVGMAEAAVNVAVAFPETPED